LHKNGDPIPQSADGAAILPLGHATTMNDYLAAPAPLSRDAWSKASQQYHRHAMATPMPLQLVGTDAPVGVLCSGCSRLVDLTHDVAACWLDAFRVDTLQRLRRWLHGS